VTDPGAEAVAVAALQARGRFGIRLGLGRTRALLAALGSPEQELRGVLIGGTNGKGSTQAIVAAILRAGGIRTGQTPKPHLVAYRERIVVDGAPIAGDALAALLTEVLAAADRVARRHGPPTEFEALTAAAFLHLARERVEAAVIEVGLGGRLDATNAWDGGVAAIVNVALDHMEHLGPTVAAIAREKAPIIKRGDRAVTGATGEALAIVRRRAARMGAPLTVTTPLLVHGMDRDGLRVEDPALGPLRVGLLGRHQAENAAVALGIVRALDAAGIARVPEAAIRRGLAEVRWPGRLELLDLAPGDLLLDGAHNAAGAAALAAAVEELRPGLAPGRPVLLLGVMADKEVGEMIGALQGSPALAGARVLAVTVPDAPRALPADALAAAWGAGAEALPSLDAAIGALRDHVRSEAGPAIVAGSLYLVGAVRGALLPGGTPA